jgi:hypothetical protein
MRTALFVLGIALLAFDASCKREEKGSCAANVPQGAIYLNEIKDQHCVDCRGYISPWYDCTVFEAFSGSIVFSHRLALTGGATFDPTKRSEYVASYGAHHEITLTEGRMLVHVQPPRPPTVPPDAIWVNDLECSAFVACEQNEAGVGFRCSAYDDVRGDAIFSEDHMGSRPTTAEALLETLRPRCIRRDGRPVLGARFF